MEIALRDQKHVVRVADAPADSVIVGLQPANTRNNGGVRGINNRNGEGNVVIADTTLKVWGVGGKTLI